MRLSVGAVRGRMIPRRSMQLAKLVEPALVFGHYLDLFEIGEQLPS
jgi:hypothetical protein